MTAIEKAVKTVSDLHDFYRRIPKISGQDGKSHRRQNQGPQAPAAHRRPKAAVAAPGPAAPDELRVGVGSERRDEDLD
jgi:hypothetical protein